MKTIFLALSISIACFGLAQGQNIILPDTANPFWTKDFQRVEIRSSKDNAPEPAMMYKTTSSTPQPLLVCLHSWTADYRQEDSAALFAKAKNWNYIHPNFRGPGWNPAGCGSDLAIADIDDAIQFMLKNASVDPKEVHIYGRSAGGHATMLAYMKLKYPAKTFSSWVGISNFVEWHFETGTRQLPQHQQLMLATGDTVRPNFAEMKKRSPIFQPLPKNRNGATLYLYTGIHDGYQGSVPVTQAIDFYNRLVKEQFPRDKSGIVPDADIIELLAKRTYARLQPNLTERLEDRIVHYKKTKAHLNLIVFEGKHEMFTNTIIATVERK